MKCTLCPRSCNADREKTYGICGSGNTPRISRAALHLWEEPCISGTSGSGAIFFSGCALHCIFCQNRMISGVSQVKRGGGLPGKETGTRDLIRIFHDLRDQGAHNINLVTGDHFIPQIAEAIAGARSMGFDLPFIFNCSGYETVESLKILQGLIDIYLPDLKYAEKDLAKSFSNAENYPETARAAITEMVRQQPDCEFDGNGLMRKGVLVRNLLLPKHVSNSKKVLKFLYESFGDHIYISILSQYTPPGSVPEEFPELKRRVKRSEYDRLVDYALSLGIKNAFIQDLSSSVTDYIPDFGI